MNNDSTRRCANSDRDLSQFVGFGYDKGRGKIAQVSWMTVSGLSSCAGGALTPSDLQFCASSAPPSDAMSLSDIACGFIGLGSYR